MYYNYYYVNGTAANINNNLLSAVVYGIKLQVKILTYNTKFDKLISYHYPLSVVK